MTLRFMIVLIGGTMWMAFWMRRGDELWIMTPEGLSFAHTGDQSNQDDFQWIDEVHRRFEVDVLMPNCWTTDPLRLVGGFRPKLVIPGHENEMGHTIDHREPFWLTYNRFDGAPSELLVMGWGERFHYRRP